MSDWLYWLLMYVLWSGMIGCWEGYRSSTAFTLINRAGTRDASGGIEYSDEYLRKVRQYLLTGAVLGAACFWPLMWVARILRWGRGGWEFMQSPWLHIEEWARWRQVPARLRRMSARQVERQRQCEALMKAFKTIGAKVTRE